MSEAAGMGRASRGPGGLSQLGGIALEAALSAAETLTGADASVLTIDVKASSRDLVTELDRSLERSIVEVISRHRPDDAVLGEEYGARRGVGEVRWLIDPIDGTTNFLQGRPDYAVAVAAQVRGVPVVGVIVKPATGEWMVSDEEGNIAANVVTPGVATIEDLSEAVVSVGVSIDEARRPITLSTLVDLLPQVRDFRRTGSTSCDLLAVATGTLDAYVGIGTKEWDVAAGWAAVRSAGGSVHQFEIAGGHVAYVLAAPSIADRLVSVVAEHATRVEASPGSVEPDITSPASGRPGRPRLRQRGEPSADVDPEVGL